MCPPPFMGVNRGGGGGMRFPLNPPPPPGPANFIPPDLGGLLMNSSKQQQAGGEDKFGGPHMQTNYRHHGGGLDSSFSNPRRPIIKPEGSYLEQLREVWQSAVGQEASGNNRFPFQNGVETFRHNFVDGGGHNHSAYNQGAFNQGAYNQGGVKRMKTGAQG